jgi:hypothetical protein
VKNQRSLAPLFWLFSILFISLAIYLIYYTPLLWFESKGNDFFVQWLAVRTFAKENLSPYLPSVQTRTEEFVYGSQAAPDEEKLKFSSPLYSVLFILPFALINSVNVAQYTWMLILGIILAAHLGIALRLTEWKPAIWLLILLIAFVLLGFHNFQALASGSMVIPSALFIFLALITIRFERYELAGLLLALATIQPRAVLLVILFILFWSFSKRLWTITFWFLAGAVILLILGVLFIPNWPVQYVQVIFNFKDYFPVYTPVAIFSSALPGMGKQLGWGLSLLMIILLIIEWFAARKKDFSWFLWTISLTIVVGQWVGIPADLNDFVLLILPLVLILATLDRRFLRYGKWMAGASLVIFLGGLWGIYFLTNPNMSSLQQDRLFLFVFPLILLVGLYWVRWWTIRPQMDFIEDIKAVDRY